MTYQLISQTSNCFVNEYFVLTNDVTKSQEKKNEQEQFGCLLLPEHETNEASFHSPDFG